MHKLLEFVCDELEELESKVESDGKLSMAEVQYLDVLAHTKKNLLKAEEMMEESEYSMDGGSSYIGGGGGQSYAGASYRSGRGGGGSRNSYARGQNARRDSRGRYSRDYRYSREGGYSSAEDNVDEIIEELNSIMGSLPEEKRKEAERFVRKMESM